MFVGAMLGTPELIIILVIVVILFGVGKLPTVGKQLGEGIKNFKNELNEAKDKDKESDDPAQLTAEDQTVTPRDVTEEHRQA